MTNATHAVLLVLLATINVAPAQAQPIHHALPGATAINAAIETRSASIDRPPVLRVQSRDSARSSKSLSPEQMKVFRRIRDDARAMIKAEIPRIVAEYRRRIARDGAGPAKVWLEAEKKVVAQRVRQRLERKYRR